MEGVVVKEQSGFDDLPNFQQRQRGFEQNGGEKIDQRHCKVSKPASKLMKCNNWYTSSRDAPQASFKDSKYVPVSQMRIGQYGPTLNDAAKVLRYHALEFRRRQGAKAMKQYPQAEAGGLVRQAREPLLETSRNARMSRQRTKRN